MASEVGNEDSMDEEHDGLDQNQPTSTPVISRKREDNDGSDNKISEIMKGIANIRKDKFEQKHSVPRFDKQKCFMRAFLKLLNACLQLTKQESEWNAAL
jgi:hypothetical protein